MKLWRVIGTVDIDGHGTQHAIAHVDPFLLLDEAVIEGEISSSFHKHPHTGLMAVTYLLNGTAHAWDNIHGATPDLNRAGGVYCVDAGRGIVHGEAPIEGLRQVRLLQLWLNPGIYQQPLPKASYQLFQPNEIPDYNHGPLWAKVIIGHAFNLTSPVVSRWPIQYLHIKIQPYQTSTIQIPNESWQGFVYILNGQGTFGANKIQGQPQDCLILGTELSTTIALENTSDETLALIVATGLPHHQPFVKLLSHGGAMIADTVVNARNSMLEYEREPECFGQTKTDSCLCA